MIDPVTGAGAYKIAGGAKGAFLRTSVFGVIGLALTLYSVAFLLPAVATVVGLFTILNLLILTNATSIPCNPCFGLSVSALFSGTLGCFAVTTAFSAWIGLIVGIPAGIYGIYPCTI